MISKYLDNLIADEQKTKLKAIQSHAEKLLDQTHRFKYFTLHGKEHIANLYKNLDILHEAGLHLNQEQGFLLGCAICVHDIGMVIPLKDLQQNEIFLGKPQPADPANMELCVLSASVRDLSFFQCYNPTILA